MKSIKIIDKGMLTTIQDLGRFGYQRYGVTPSGVMDEYSAKMANILVGNELEAPVIETTFKGAAIEFSGDSSIAITGGDNIILLNDIEVPMWESIRIKNGDIVKMNFCKSGVRNYISIHGGFDIPKVLGSYSTNIKSKLGGFEGRALENDDVIPLKNIPSSFIHKTLSNQDIPKFSGSETIGVILGPQDDEFTEEGHKTFFNSEYEVSKEGDRMGIRFLGEKVDHINGADIISDGISFGAIQIPGNGQPIIMMADRQTTGGYTKIGNVITADLYKVAQLPPGSKVKFQQFEEQEAIEALKKHQEKLKKAERGETVKNLQDYRKLKLEVNLQEFNVYIKEV